MRSWTAILCGCLCSMMLVAIGGFLFPIATASQPVGFADRPLFVDAAPPGVYVTPDHAAVRSRFLGPCSPLPSILAILPDRSEGSRSSCRG